MDSRSERGITETTREIYELCCSPGARIKYQTLRLEKLDRDTDHDRWRVTRDGEYIDTINVDAFRSASQLQQWLDAVSDGRETVLGEHCESCPLHAVPGD